MFLTASNLFFYLRDAGLCSAEDVTGEDFAVTETGRRNRNFAVARRKAPSLFVEQIPMVHPEVIGSLRREAACAQLARDAGEGSALATCMPSLLRYDPAANVLVYRLADAADNLNQRVARDGPPTPEVARRIGSALAGCHSETARPGALLGIAAALKAEPPWISAVLRQPDAVMPGMNEARRDIAAAMRAMPEVFWGLEALRLGWRRLCLTHGDVKFDNILVGREADDPRLLLVDWELADLGEPLWDVACSLAALAQPWLIGAVVAGRPADARDAGGAIVGPARALWSAYAAATAPAAGPLDLDLLARLVGARFALLAFELLPDGVPGSPLAGSALAVARSFFAAPSAALAAMFGLVAARPSDRPTLRAPA